MSDTTGVEHNTLRGILIDPYTRTIMEVHVAPYPAWKIVIKADSIEHVPIMEFPTGVREGVWVDEEGLLHEKRHGPYFQIATNPQPIAGKGIVFGTDATGETISTKLTVDFVKEIVTWPNVVFEGFSEIEPHEETHAHLGKVHVMGQRTHFRPMTAEEVQASGGRVHVDDSFPDDENDKDNGGAAT